MDEPRPSPARQPQLPAQGWAPARQLNRLAWAAGLLGALGVWGVGTQGGFQHYLVVIPPLLALQTHRPPMARLAALALCLVAYLVLDAVGPVWTLPAGPAAWLYRANACAGWALLSALAWVCGSQMHAAQARLRRSTSSDPLTGLLNRPSWIEGAQNLLARTQHSEPGATVGLLIVGVDLLKAVNDRHGQAAGDLVLVTVAAALQHGLRERDLLARWGGDQYIALLASHDAKSLRMVGERLRALVQAATVRVAETSEVLPLSASMGLTEVAVGEPLEAAIARADQALIAAKQAGRNRVVVAPPAG